jgi:hypothetical protein
VDGKEDDFGLKMSLNSLPRCAMSGGLPVPHNSTYEPFKAVGTLDQSVGSGTFT